MQQLLNQMKRTAGYREKAVLEIFRDGEATMQMIQGQYVKFKYSPDVEYQDANGAMYDLVSKRWVN